MRGILDKVASGQTGREQDAVSSIVGNLRALLNSRRGDSTSAPEFGIPCFCDLMHGFPESLAQLQQAVKATILEFEPRLKNVVVRHVPGEDPLVIHFEITGQLASRNGRRMLRFRTDMAAGGHVEVS